MKILGITRLVEFYPEILENNMAYQDWLKIVAKFDNDQQLKICPNCKKLTINYQFVGDKKNNVGHLYLWCNSCLNGIHVSRVTIPPNVDVLPFDVLEEELSKIIPKYKLTA